jgi:hypothetical protein
MNSTYASSQKAIHWAIFPLVIGLYGLTYAEDLFPRGDFNRDLVWWFHISFGLLLFGLVVLRIGLRLMYGAPALPSEMTPLERWLAKIASSALRIACCHPGARRLPYLVQGRRLELLRLGHDPLSVSSGSCDGRVHQGTAWPQRQSDHDLCRGARGGGSMAPFHPEG